MSEAVERISALEREIVALVNWRVSLELIAVESRNPAIRIEIVRVTRRIAKAQAEIVAIENAFFAEVMSARRDSKYPRVEIKPIRMEFL